MKQTCRIFLYVYSLKLMNKYSVIVTGNTGTINNEGKDDMIGLVSKLSQRRMLSFSKGMSAAHFIAL